MLMAIWERIKENTRTLLTDKSKMADHCWSKTSGTSGDTFEVQLHHTNKLLVRCNYALKVSPEDAVGLQTLKRFVQFSLLITTVRNNLHRSQ